MKTKQVSVFVENQPGRLVAMLQALKDKDINIAALSVAEGTDFGIARMILSDTAKGTKALRDAGFTARETTVIKKEMPDKPGGLLDVIEPLAKAGVNVEYFYAFVDPTPNTATIVFKVSDPERAEEIIGR